MVMTGQSASRALDLHTWSANVHATTRQLRGEHRPLDELKLRCEFLNTNQLFALARSLRALIVSSIQLTAPFSGKMGFGWDEIFRAIASNPAVVQLQLGAASPASITLSSRLLLCSKFLHKFEIPLTFLNTSVIAKLADALVHTRIHSLRVLYCESPNSAQLLVNAVLGNPNILSFELVSSPNYGVKFSEHQKLAIKLHLERNRRRLKNEIYGEVSKSVYPDVPRDIIRLCLDFTY
eukprot:16173_1